MPLTNYLTTASLSYFLPPADGSSPYADISADSVTGIRRRNWVKDRHLVEVENVRGSEDQYKLDSAGFQFGREASKNTTFLDDQEIEVGYHSECINLIKRFTGASRVVIFDHSQFAVVSR